MDTHSEHTARRKQLTAAPLSMKILSVASWKIGSRRNMLKRPGEWCHIAAERLLADVTTFGEGRVRVHYLLLVDMK